MTDNILSQAVAQLRAINSLPPRNALKSERDALTIRIAALNTELETISFDLGNMQLLVDEVQKSVDTRSALRAEVVEALNAAIRSKADLDQRVAEL